MAVIINELEVIVDPPSARPGAAAPSPPVAAPAPVALDPRTLARIERHRRARAARLRAH